ncbi:MAG: GIY-YIG nuclease family protein [Bacteroidota bacterium]
MKSYYVYVLKCADNTHYTSITSNLAKRLSEHHHGKRKGTKYKRPLELAFCTRFTNISKAVNSEIAIKKWIQNQREQLAEKGSEWLTALLKKPLETQL